MYNANILATGQIFQNHFFTVTIAWPCCFTALSPISPFLLTDHHFNSSGQGYLAATTEHICFSLSATEEDTLIDSRRESRLNRLEKKASRVPLSLFPISFSAFVDTDKGVSLCLPWDQMHPGSRQDANPWKPLCSSRYRTLKLLSSFAFWQFQMAVKGGKIWSSVNRACKVMSLNNTSVTHAFQQGRAMILYNEGNKTLTVAEST